MFVEDRFDGGDANAPVTLSPNEDGAWILPEGVALFTAEFSRDHFDLVLQTQDGATLRLDGYFASQTLVDLQSSDGAVLRGPVVESLAGPLFPGQYAQLGGGAVADAIGQVETLVGVAFVQRTDGQVAELEIGTKVFQGDIVRTENGGTLGLTFADGTIFTLASGSRMVLDELIYDASATDNSGVFNLIEGSFVFIAGQTAKTGGIEINTPAATMGIRGTTGKIDIETVNGVATVTVSLNPDPDGSLGVIELRDLDGNLISSITGTETKWIIRPPFTNEPPIEVSRETLDLGQDAPLLDQALAAYQAAVGRVTRGEEFVEFSDGEPDQGGDDQQPEETEDDAPPPDAPPADAEVEDIQQEFQEEEAPEDAEPLRPAPLGETGDGDEGDGPTGSGNPELDGNDEPIIQQEGSGSTDDDAALQQQTNEVVQATDNVRRTRFSDLEVQGVEDNAVTVALPVEAGRGEPVPVTVTTDPSNGAVEIADDGTFTYTPDEDFEGTDSFVISGTDETGETQEAEITVVVDPVNDAPVVNLRLVDAASVEEGANTPLGSGSVGGTLTYVDVDEGATPGLWSIQASADNTTSFGSITIDAATGRWEYELDQQATDSLGEGEAFEETYVATVVDTEGATDESLVVITVTGTNDAPEVSVAVGQTDVSMITGPRASEEAAPGFITSGTVSGVLAYTDVDEGASTAVWTIAPDANNETFFGAISINAETGEWQYDLPLDEPIPLGDGETVTERFTATVTDAEGATAEQEISISITGTNEAPVIVFSIEDVTATVFEAGFEPDAEIALRVAPDSDLRLRTTASDDEGGSNIRARLDGGPDATGTLRYVDADGESGAATWSIEVDDASFGEMTIDAVTGEWHYFLDEEAANSLRQGDTVVETFIATVTDPFGGTASQVITITVQGSNDAAELVADPQDLVGTVAEGGVATATGRLNFVDPDALPGDTATWAISADGPSRGVMQIDADTGQWLYTLDADASESLGAGAPETETFTATVTDALGAEADQTIIITLNGENDGPVLVTGAASLLKDDANVVVDLSELGSDIDDGEDGSTLIYTISTDPNEGLAEINGTELVFSTDGAFADLGAGETRIVTVGITATDSFGATATNSVEITVTGTDTGPQITSSAADASGDVVEAGDATSGTSSISGTLSYSDPDASTPTSGTWSATPNGGTIGSLSINATSGVWTYTLNENAADSLNDGETVTDTFRATITDEDGQSAIEVITITITGSNDAPSLVAAVGSLGKDDASLVLDLASFGRDPDAEDTGASLTYDLDSGPATGSGSATLSGSTLTFNTDGDFDSLGDGDSQTVTISIGVTDAQGLRVVSDVTLTVTGSTSAPEITSDAAAALGDVVESGASVSGTLVATNTLTYLDADAASPTAGTWTISPDLTAFGAMSINATTGVWRYELDDSAADSLNDGETRNESFTATITDADGFSDSQEITITITGTNDAPELESAIGTVSNDQASLTLDLSLFGVDPDAEDTGTTLEYDLDAALGAGDGSASVAGNTLTFSTDGDFDGLSDGQSRDVTVQIGVTDAQGLRTVSDVTITVTGSTSAPEITSNAAAALGDVRESGASTTGQSVATGTLTYVDADAASATEGTWTIFPAASALGGITIDGTTGAWRYTLDDSAADSLNDGEEVEEQFAATITDADGLFDTQVITITITGSNDAPSLQSAVGSVAKDEATLTLDLSLFGFDPDSEDTGATLEYDLDAALGVGDGSASVAGNTLTFSTDGDFDGLSDGQSRDVTVQIGVTDAQGLRTVSDVTITVTGSTSAPEITSDAAAALGSVAETGVGVSGQLAASGTLTYDDPDAASATSGTWTIFPASSALGSISIDPTSGAWSYTLDDSAANSLDEGDIVEEQFAATITDVDGLFDTQVITITITGTNDVPTLDADSRTIAKDTASVLFDLSTVAADADLDDTIGTLTFTVETDPDFGSAAISGSDLTFFTDTGFDDLAPGESREDTVEVRVTDTNGAFAIQTFTVTVTGSNEAPVITSTTADANGAATEDATPSASTPDATGTLTYSDADERAGFPATWSVEANSSPALGRVEIDANTGAWEYFLDDSAVDDLREGAVVTETYTATVEDEFGATATQVMTMTITGTNDAPVITTAASDATGTATTGGPATLTGQIDFIDPDVAVNAVSWSVEPIPSPQSYGSMTISGAGVWTFSVNAAAVDALADGDVAFNTFAARVRDEFGATDTIIITIRVEGSNVAPLITSSAAEAQGDVIESADVPAGAVTTSGQLAVTDPDQIGDPTWTLSPISTVLLGSMGIGVTTGAWTYTLNDAAADELDAGDEVIEEYLATVTDSEGATATQVLTITITGTNDSPTLSQFSAALTNQNDTTTVDLRAISDDVDAEDDPADLSFAIAPGAFKGLASITNGVLSFDPNGEFLGLEAGETEDVTINVTVSDPQGGEATSDITIRVSGQNDAPIITSGPAAAAGAITENGDIAPTPATSVGGTLTYTDSDEAAPNSATWNVSPPTTTFGSITIGATTGVWEYTLDQTAADVLNEGETRIETFTATVQDAAGAADTQTITVTITGTNDGPTLAAGTLAATEDGGSVTLDLSTLGNDIDAENDGFDLTYSIDTPVAGASITNNILTFDPGTDFQDLAVGETQDITVNIIAEDDRGATASNAVTVTVTGANDTPTVPNFSDTVGESGTVSLNLAGVGSDADNGASLTYSVITVPTKGFTQFLGTTVVFRTDGDFETLAAGQTEDVIIGYRASDGQGGVSDEGFITFTVVGQNDAPALAAGTLAATEDGGAVTLDLTTLGNDVDDGEDGSTLTYALDGVFAGADVDGNGVLTFDPGTDFQNLAGGQTEDVTIDIVATDGSGLEARNSVTVTVTGVNDDPTLAAGTLAATENGGNVTLDLSTLGNDPDTGEDGSTLTYRIDGSVTGASITNGILSYNANEGLDDLALGETRDVDIDIIATDGALAEVSNTVTVTVTGTNDAPELLTNLATLTAFETNTFSRVDVPAFFTFLGRATDADSDDDASSLSYLFSNASTTHFSVTASAVRLNIAGNYEFLAAGAVATETIDVTATDRHGEVSNVGTITWRIEGANDDPTLAQGSLAVVEDAGAVTLDLTTLGDDVDAGQAATLTYSLVGAPVEASIIGGTTLSYDPGAGFQNLAAGDTQDVSLTVEVDDGDGGTATNTVTVTVTGVNDNAVLANGSATVGERDGSTFIDLSGLVTDVDDGEDGTNKTYIIDEPPLPGKGTVTIDGLGVRFDPDGDFNNLLAGETEDVTFTVQAVDAADAGRVSNIATITVTVTGANNPPEAQDFTVSHDGNAGALSIDALAQVLDDDDTVIEIISLGTPGAGAAVIDDMGTADVGDDVILYTPDLVTDGSPDSFTYTVEDSAGNQATGTITVNVPQNTAPIAFDTSTSIALSSRAGMSFSADSFSWYEFVRGYYTWDDAKLAAIAKGGDLAEISNENENTFVGNLVSSAGGDIDGWLGGTDAGSEGLWLWDRASGSDLPFWNGTADSGSAIMGRYENWFEGQPNATDAAANDHLSIRRFGEGSWDDVNGADPRGYVVELGATIAAGTLNQPGIVINQDAADPLTFSLNAPVAGLTFDSNGFWTFDPSTDAYASLADGEILDVIIEYTVTDERGASDTANFTLTVTGDNDAPTVADESVAFSLIETGGGAPAGAGWTQWAVDEGGNGHYYGLFTSTFTWTQAQADLATEGGYLANITSAAENNFISTVIAPNSTGFFGASDAGVEGEWRWDGGPEAGQQFWQGASSGSAVGGLYSNWETSPAEPSNFQPDFEDFGFFSRDGTWESIGSTTRGSYIGEVSSVQFVTGDVSTNDSDPDGPAGDLVYALSGTYAGLTMNADGTWQFNRTTDAYDYLAGGETLVLNAYYTVTDQNGAGESSDGKLQITLTGIDNAAPVLGADAAVQATAAIDTGPTGGGWSQWSGNDHYYQFIASSTFTWSDAQSDAETRGGHLATITSAGEQTFVEGIAGGSVAFIGASDAAVEGEWRWVEGPEINQLFFVQGTGAVGGAYSNWSLGQPNPSTENVAHLFGDGTWNDLSDIDTPSTTFGYVLEYSGVPVLSGSVADNDTHTDPLTYTVTSAVAGATLDETGFWTFDASDPAYVSLGAGVTQTFQLAYTASDAGGASANGTLDFEVTGINDAPNLVTTDLDFGVVSETAGMQFYDLLSAANDPDIGDNLEVRNFTYAWTGDGPSPMITPVGGSIVELDPSLFTSLDAGETARLTMNYDVSDGTIDVAREAIVDISGVANTFQANTDNLSPTGIPAFNEDSAPLITAAQLLSNDTNTTGQAANIISVTGFEGINVIGYSQQAGALLTLSGGDIIYNGTHSARLNDLSGSQTLVDNFYYTIETADGLQTSSAEVAFVVQGLAPSGDAAPEAAAVTGVGFRSGVSTTYEINTQFMRDVDQNTGMVYKIGSESFTGHPDGALPDYLEFDPDFFNGFLNPNLTVNLGQYTGGSQQVTDLFLTGFEGDGDYLAASFTVVLDSVGNMAYTKYGFDNAGITNLVEEGIDPNFALGDIATGVDFDLSGLDTLTPTTLRDMEVLQLRNSQENNLTIDLDDVLAIIEGNPGTGTEVVRLTVDAFDNVEVAANSNYDIFYSANEAVATLSATPSGVFAGSGFFLQFQMDGGTFDNIPSS